MSGMGGVPGATATADAPLSAVAAAPAGSSAAPLVFTKHVKHREKTYEVPAPLAPLFDTHAHLTCFWTKDPAEVLVRAARAGVRRIVTLYDPLGDDFDGLAAYQEQLAVWLDASRALAGADVCAGAPTAGDAERALAAGLDSEAAAAAPAAASPMSNAATAPATVAAGALDLIDHVRYLVGVHPYGAPDYTDATHAVLEAALNDLRCAGIGEIGLDYHFDADDQIEAAPHDVQIEVMARQLELAVTRNVPVELHLRNDDADERREAHADARRVLVEVGVPAAGCVLHCFGEDRPTMERFLELGCHIAFGGAATFKRNEHIREAFAACPLDRILFETDCPYMAPEPIRGLECEPAMIAFTADALCRDRAGRTGEGAAEIARAAWENACRLFG